MYPQFLQRIILILVLSFVLQQPPIICVERPEDWIDDGVYKGEDKLRSGLHCYDCLDCDEPFTYEHRACFSAINCFILRAKLKINGFTEGEFYKKRLSKDEFKKWVHDWYKRAATFRGCSDYGFNCSAVMEKHSEEGLFKAPIHMLEVLECEECESDFCNDRKTQDHPMVDRAAVLATSGSNSIYFNNALILCGYVRLINDLWCV